MTSKPKWLAFTVTLICSVGSCVNLENVLLFASGNSSSHVDEYHFEDSLSGISDSNWALFDRVGEIQTDALWLKTDTPLGNTDNRFVVLYFNARDACLLSGVTTGKLFRSLGIDFFSIDYRGYGRSYPDFKPSEASLYEDGENALSFLIDSLGYSQSSIILTGFSLGTGVATELASKRSCGALVLFAAYTNMDNSVETLVGGYNIPGRWFLDARFDNLSKISSINMPLCLLSGRDDTFVTPDHTEQLFKVANEPKEMYLLSKQDHNKFVTDSFEQWKQLLLSFLERLKIN